MHDDYDKTVERLVSPSVMALKDWRSQAENLMIVIMNRRLEINHDTIFTKDFVQKAMKE